MWYLIWYEVLILCAGVLVDENMPSGQAEAQRRRHQCEARLGKARRSGTTVIRMRARRLVLAEPLA